MASFAASLTPGVVPSLSDLLTVRFTDPPPTSGELNVRIKEADSWSVNGKSFKEGSGVDDIILDTRGFFKDKKFIQTLVVVPPNPKKGSAPRALLNLKLAEASPVQVPITNDPGEEEQGQSGFFEIYVEVSEGKAPNEKVLFKSAAPAYVRTQPRDRPIVAFVTGADTRGFFDAAREYWRRVSDRDTKAVNDTRTNLRDIMKYLRDNKKSKPFGEVNIVSHGTRFILNLSGTPSEGAGRANGSEEIQELVKSRPPGFEPLDPDVLDDKSIVVIRGCNIGHNSKYLQAIRDLFGGRAPVIAPLFLQFYESPPQPRRRRGQPPPAEIVPFEAFQEQFFFFQPGATKPTRAQAQSRIAQDNPGLSGFEKMEFRQRLHTFTFSIEGNFRGMTDTAIIESFRSQVQPLLKRDLNENTNFDDWGWTLINGRRVMLGRRVKSEFRRDLLDPPGTPGTPSGTGPRVVPSLNNSAHYQKA